jgi:transcription elongation factor GreA
MSQETEHAASELVKQLRDHKYSKIDELWIQLLDEPPTQGEFYRELAQRLVRARREEKLVELVALAVMQWAEQGRPRDALKVIQIVLPHLRKNPKDLHEPLLTCLRAAYADRANLERFLRASGLLYDTEIGKNYQTLILYMACDEGQVFQHASRGVGIVQVIDEHEGFVDVDFGDGRAPRFSFDGVRQYLRPVREGHILARKARDPKGLKERSQKDPAGFTRALLKDFGGKIRQSELKSVLTDQFLTVREWTSWWNRNRVRIRLDPYIEFRGASNVTMVLRKTPRSYHDECAETFERAETWAERRDILRQLKRAQAAEAAPREALERLARACEIAFEDLEPGDVSGSLEAACLAEDLKELAGEDLEIAGAPDPQSVLSKAVDRQAAIQNMTILDYQIRALGRLAEAAEDWADVLASMFLDAPVRVAQVVMNMLFERGKEQEATEALETLLARPSINPEAFAWVCWQILGEKWQKSAIDMPTIYLLICMLDFMEELGADIANDESAPLSKRNAYSRIRAALMTEGHENVCRVIRDVSTEEARHFLASIRSHRTLNDTHKLSLETALRNIRSDFDDPSRTESGTHFVTAAALRRMEEEYQRIKTVEIPENSRAIGAARELGDLRENADFHAAKDHQKLLFSRVEELHDLLARARVLVVEHVRTDVVGPGARLTARNLEAGADEVYTLLGRWDADVERNILSYSSPFAAHFLGKKPGDSLEVELPSGQRVAYQVVSIENALAEPAEAAATLAEGAAWANRL